MATARPRRVSWRDRLRPPAFSELAFDAIVPQPGAHSRSAMSHRADLEASGWQALQEWPPFARDDPRRCGFGVGSLQHAARKAGRRSRIVRDFHSTEMCVSRGPLLHNCGAMSPQSQAWEIPVAPDCTGISSTPRRFHPVRPPNTATRRLCLSRRDSGNEVRAAPGPESIAVARPTTSGCGRAYT